MRRPIDFASRIHGEWLLLVGVVLLVVFGVGLAREVVRRRAIVQEINDLKREVAQLSDRRRELQQLIAEFQTATVQEREARTRLNLARPGESVLLIQQSDAGSASEVPAAGEARREAAPARTMPEQWWEYFFGT